MKRPLFSRFYDCDITHVRTEPVRNSFVYSYLTFCLDLDEVDQLQGSLFGTRWWNVFRFVPTDFIFGRPEDNHLRTSEKHSMKRAIQLYARDKGVDNIERIELIAHMRTFFYAFNPAAFYFCYGKKDEVLCAILEVTNTFHEKKTYFIPANGAGSMQGSQIKEFYVSPFVDLDAEFEFKLAIPADRLRLEINSLKDGKYVVRSIVTGSSLEWTSSALWRHLLYFPFITFQVIARIHYRAFILYLKKVPYFRKKDRLELQKGGLS